MVCRENLHQVRYNLYETNVCLSPTGVAWLLPNGPAFSAQVLHQQVLTFMSHDVLNSEHKLPDDTTSRCCQCGRTATYLWPTLSVKPQAYCDAHLADAKHRLSVALGQANAK